jgi:hypothetical protein
MRFLAQGLALDAMTIAVPAFALVYRTRVTMPRPPVGVFTRSDIVIMITLLAVMPYAYLHLPITAVIVFLGILMLGMVHLTLAPVLGGKTALLAALALCAAAVISHGFGWQVGVLAANDLILVLAVIGATNLWAQTGITPGQVTGLAAALAIYDLLATGMSTTTVSFVDQVIGKPFAPLLMSGYGATATFIGMGDCLLLTIWPLVAASTYGRLAASLAVAVDVLLLTSIQIGFLTGLLVKPVPVATPLGILIVIQYLFWRRRTPPETSTRSFLDAALRPLSGVDTAQDEWVALHDGKVVATGSSPGTARKAARRAGLTAVPITSLAQRPCKPEEHPNHPATQPDREYAGTSSGHVGSPR